VLSCISYAYLQYWTAVQNQFFSPDEFAVLTVGKWTSQFAESIKKMCISYLLLYPCLCIRVQLCLSIWLLGEESEEKLVVVFNLIPFLALLLFFCICSIRQLYSRYLICAFLNWSWMCVTNATNCRIDQMENLHCVCYAVNKYLPVKRVKLHNAPSSLCGTTLYSSIFILYVLRYHFSCSSVSKAPSLRVSAFCFSKCSQSIGRLFFYLKCLCHM